MYESVVQNQSGEFYLIDDGKLFPLSRQQKFLRMDTAMVCTLKEQAGLALSKWSDDKSIWLEFKLINFNEEFELTGICKWAEKQVEGSKAFTERLYLKVSTLSKTAKAKLATTARKAKDKPIIKFRPLSTSL